MLAKLTHTEFMLLCLTLKGKVTHTLSITMHNLPVFTPTSCLGEITITIPRPLSHQGWRTGTPLQSSSDRNLSGRCNSCSRFSEYINIIGQFITHGLLPLPKTPADQYNSFPFFSSWFSSPSCFTVQANVSMFSHRQVHTQLLAFTIIMHQNIQEKGFIITCGFWRWVVEEWKSWGEIK